MAFGIFTGPLKYRGYFRPLVVNGSLLTVFGAMMTSIANSYHQIFLAQGICLGLGMGFTYVPILAAVSMHFTTRRPLALAICATGACIGGTVVPIMLRQLIPKIGFGWAVRSVAFLNLACAIIALGIVCQRPSQAHPARRLFDLSALREPPYVLFTLAIFLIFLPYYVPFTYIPLFARTALHTSENLAGYLLAVANAGSLFGRIVPYLLGSKVTPIRLFVLWSIASVALLFW
jgi:predicted MFS family arabinose efflux permease